MTIFNKKRVMEQKQCTKCLEWKDQSEFFTDKQKATGYRPDCKKCCVKRNVSYNRKHKDRNKMRQIKWSTGISEKDYTTLLNVSGHKCAICGKPEDQRRRLSIDHCHKTQLVRGLLCHHCNAALGLFQDNSLLLKKAIAYLKKNYSGKGIIHKEKKHKIKRHV